MATYHVKTTAAGGGDGSSGNPWTLQEALDTAVAGDVVMIWDGTYTISATLDADLNAGTEGSPVQFVGANSSGTEDGTRPVITTSSTLANGLLRNGGTNITHREFRHIDFNGGGASRAAYCVNFNNANSSDHWTFIDCIFRSATSHGLYVRTAIRLVRCAIHSNAGSGIDYFSTGGHLFHMTSCRVYGNTSHGVYINVDHAVFSRCAIYRNGGDGIKCDGASRYWAILFCTIYDNTGDGIDLNAGMLSPSIVGNIIAENGGYGINFNGTFPGGVLEWNDANGNTSGAYSVTVPGGYYNVTSAPAFEDTGSGTEDFTPDDGSNADGTGPSPMANGDVDIGAVKAADPAGGGGGLLTHPGMAGGMRG